jgi:hypothetical protein
MNEWCRYFKFGVIDIGCLVFYFSNAYKRKTDSHENYGKI